MFLKRLYIRNIRSYESQEIHFNKGITLLAGDIGSGKSTILLALEFALFGILRGKMSPAELLRHGSKEGSVTLECIIQNKEIKITRGLRRRGSGIAQLSGTLSIDNNEEELVPTEIKARVLQLLGYPESLIAKSTNLFRYTVYTPQEQVKNIIYESVDERKDVVRKIFQFDKYQVVGQNITIYAQHLRERIAQLSGQIEDIHILTQQQESQKRELEQIHKQLPTLSDTCKGAEEQVIAMEKKLQELQKQQQEQDNQKNKFLLLQNEIKSLKQRKNERLEYYTSLQNQIKKITPLPALDTTLDRKIKDMIQKCIDKKEKIHTRLGQLEGKRQTDHSVQHLEVCPTCKQAVSESHKKQVQQLQEQHNKKISAQQNELRTVLVKVNEKQQAYEQQQGELRKKQQEHAVNAQKLKQQEQVQKEMKELLIRIRRDEELITQKKEELLKKNVDKLPKIEFKGIQDKLTLLRKQYHQQEREKTQLETREQIATKTLRQLQITLSNKNKARAKKEELTAVKEWLQKLFLPLINVMEKRVLLRVYKEFQKYFTEWFTLLVADQELEVHLDEDFTPLVLQQGFDTTISNLSGGEKTGVALAYRLALNKVLNDYFSFLHTKGLLILDEPTDGFSSEQIDRLRDVFEQVGVTQLLLVSHEPRLESVADHVVRVHKQHHQSLVQ